MGDTNYSSYKDLKEQFVSGHRGSTAKEITLIYFGIACCVFLHSAGGIGYRKQCFHILCDFLVLVLPGLSSVTFLSESKSTVIVTLLSLATVSIIISRPFNRAATKSSISFLRQDFGNKLEFVSNFRAYALICTAICILAVDFSVFPRRFCKAETFGTGLMDTGVGLFIVANGIVSPESRNKAKVSSLKSSLLSSLPLIVLGLGRILSTKSVDYQEHVTEYGVHWNFFFTVSAVKISSSLLLTFLGNTNLTGTAIILILSYQLCLTKLDLSKYLILGADGLGGRVGFFDSNREGIVSCLGYLSLYFLAVELGKHIFNKERKTVGDWLPFLGVLGLLQTILWCAMVWSETHVQQVSRRFANLSYVIWMLALSVFLLFLLLLVDLCSQYQSFLFAKKREEDVCLLSAVNYNGLTYFLLANVLTGLVNLSVDTLQITTVQSMTILIFYMGILSIVTLMLCKWKIRLKYW